jgi:hypothetical protein
MKLSNYHEASLNRVLHLKRRTARGLNLIKGMQTGLKMVVVQGLFNGHPTLMYLSFLDV